MSSVSPNMPTFPSNAGSNDPSRSHLTPGQLRVVADPRDPHMYRIENWFPGSYGGSWYFDAAFAAKFGGFEHRAGSGGRSPSSATTWGNP
jgi:hypothetical protein